MPATSDRDLAPFFRSLSDATRLRLLNLLAEGEVCVCHLAEVLDSVQPKVSRHLAYLKKCGLVQVRREGKWMHYQWARPRHPAARNMMDGLRDWMVKDRQMARDRKKLKKVCCV